MSHLGIFLNTRIYRSGVLASAGDFGLMPVRYLFGGKNVTITRLHSGALRNVEHKASFNHSENSFFTKMVKTAAAITLLVPGLLLLSPLKLISYAYRDVRGNHYLAKEHFTPSDRVLTVGSPNRPILSEDRIWGLLIDAQYSDPLNHPVDAIVIYGNGNVKITDEHGIPEINSMKLILVGASIDPLLHRDSDSLFVNALHETHKWETHVDSIEFRNKLINKTFVIQHTAKSVDEALEVKAPKRGWLTSKVYHQVFLVPNANSQS